jgi:hypothetical protein
MKADQPKKQSKMEKLEGGLRHDEKALTQGRFCDNNRTMKYHLKLKARKRPKKGKNRHTLCHQRSIA